MKLIAVAVAASIALPIAAGESPYSDIDGRHLKQYVEELAAMSRRYRDNGHPQYWGRIIGSDADAENGKWLLERFKAAGLKEVKEQPFDLPPQWWPQAWSVNASGAGNRSRSRARSRRTAASRLR